MIVKHVHGNDHIIIAFQQNFQIVLCEPWQFFPQRALKEVCGAEEERGYLKKTGFFLYLGKKWY